MHFLSPLWTSCSQWFVLAFRTPFHADVFRSYSWSANICGRKKWLLYPPGQEDFLRDCHGNLAYDVTAPALQDKRLYPQFVEACQPLEIIQEAGEIIFVPSGWHHQVYNLVSNNGLLVSIYVVLKQGCPILLPEDQCPAEFCSNLHKYTCLDIFHRKPLACQRAKHIKYVRFKQSYLFYCVSSVVLGVNLTYTLSWALPAYTNLFVFIAVTV